MDYEGSRENETESELSHIAPEIAAALAAATRTGGVPLLPDAQNVVVLPQGASLDDIAVRGRDLVIQLADGRVFVIPDGAVFVPQIVVDGVAVPPLNLAALLIGEQPQPAAGPVQSSGSNFAEPNGPIQDAFGLGDLLPYTELLFPQARTEELFPVVDHEPEVTIFTPGNLLGAIAATASVREEGLPARGSEPPGSNAAANSETTTGTIVFESLDGLRSVTINGTAITAVGQTFATDKGVLTITSLTPGNYGYSYTLSDNTSGDATSDAFAVTVTDTDGDVATATLTIAIVDDVPTARNDTDTIPAGTFGPATGNVITGLGTTNAPGSADTVGADNAQVSRIASNNVPANVDTAFDASGNLEVAGQYGVLTIRADGSYSYLRNPNTPGGRDEVFTYTLTDGDGDTATATLTIAIGDAAPRVLDLTPKASGGDALVDEDDLSDGSDTAKESLTATGTFTVSSPDGVGSLAVDGHIVVSNGTFTAASWTTPLGNTLAVTGYNSATGVVTYTYTLLDNENHPAADGENALFEDFAVTLTDLDGDAASDTLSVQIVDDVPTARNDTDTLPNSSTQESGNVITGLGTTSGNAGADTQGADGAAVSGLRAGTSGAFANAGSTVTGQFGTLTLGANGTYTYTRSGNAGSGQTDTFSYQLTDGDGDISTATLVITIPDRPATVTSVPTTGGSTTVNESGLPPRGSEPAGTNEPASVETTTGTITFSTPDGFGSLKINTVTITGAGQVIPTPQGDFTVTGFNPAAGTLTYSFTLADNTSGDSTSVTLSVTVTDSDGDTDTKPFVITIVDDAPIARDDTDSVASGTLVATGNILTGTDFAGGDANASDGVGDTPGADGAVLTKVASNNVPANFDDNATGGFDVAGQYGTLHVDAGGLANGNYTYTRNANTPGGVQDKFTYTLTDGDGDVRTATLTIGIDNRTPAGGTANVVLDDDDVNANGIAGAAINGDLAPLLPSGPLPDPSQGDAPLTYSFPAPGAAPAGFSYDSATANTLKIFQTQGANQVLVVTVTLTNPATGAYTVVQNAAILHAAGGNENNTDFAISYQVKDQDNQTATGTLNIRVNDDMPVATLADRGVPGLVLDESANATDTAGAVSPAGRSTITADFSVNFNTAAYGADGAGSVAYSLLLSANGIGSGLYALDTTDKLVDGDGYGQGAEILLSQSGNTITGSVGATPYFTLVINPASGVVTFTQLANIWHPNAGSTGAAHDDAATMLTALATDIKVQQTVTDADGDSATESVAIGRNVFAIQDDGPAAVNDTDTTGAPGTTATGNVITGTDIALLPDANGTDGVLDKKGTDGATVSQIVATSNGNLTDTSFDGNDDLEVAGLYGTLKIKASGDYTYTRNAGTPGGAHDLFTYTLTDGDGDTSTATLDITLGNAAPAGGTANVVLDDDDVNANGIAGVAINGDLDASPPAGPLPDPSQGDAPLTYSFPAPGLAPAGFTYDTATANTLKIFQTQGANQVLVVTVTLTDPATGAYTVVQNATILHAAGGNENNVDFAIAYQVKDADNQTANGTLNIKVNDDTPTATASANSTVTAIVDETSSTTTAATLGAANIGNDPDVTDAPNANGYIARVVTGGAVVSPGGGYGADGAGTLSYALTVTNATSGLMVTDGSAINLVLEGSIVVGRVQGGSFANQAAFAIGIDASGVVTVEQYLSLKHPSNPNPDEALPLGPNTLGVTLTRTDADNDSTISAAADISGQIQFRDDGPTANPDTDTVLAGALTAAGNVISGLGTTNAPGSADKAGADGGARVTFIDHSDANPGAAVPDGGAVNIAGDYGTLNIASTGAYTYTRNANSPGGVEDTFTYTLIDGDGDTVTTTLKITVNNSAPAAGTVNATLDDDALTNGIAGDNGDGTDANPDTSLVAGTLPDPLAGDAPLTYALSAGVTAAGGAANLTYVLTGDVLEIKQGGVTAITVTLTDHIAGTYTIVQNKPLVHATGGSENNQTFAIPYSVTDQDGQVANGTINIDVDDDTPRSSVGTAPPTPLVLDESAVGTDTAGGSAPTGLGTVTVSFAGKFNAVQYGADGAGSLGYALLLNGANVNSGLFALDTTDVLADGDGYGQGAAILLNQSGNTITGSAGGLDYFTIAINPANGDVTFTQLRNVWHANAGSTGAAYDDAATLLTSLVTDIKVQQTVTDADGDNHASSINVGRDVFSIQDDGPDAVNDTDTTGAPLSVATGNVITDLAAGDLGDSDTGADKTGTDGATIAALVSVDVPGNPDTDPGSGFSVAGQYGTLTMQTNGDYSYTRNAGTPGGAKDTFTYTLKDGDGDTDTATLEITLGNSAPSGGTASVVLDDDDVVGASGLLGGPDDIGLSPPAGPLPDASQGDAPLTYSFPAPGAAPAGFSYDTLTANTLKIFQTQGVNQVLVVTVTLTNPATGAYTVVQNAPIAHAADTGGPDDDRENNQDFAIAYQVKDADNQTATGTLNIRVNDDTPTAGASAAALDTLVLDETRPLGSDTVGATGPNGLAAATAAFADNFNAPAYGADGAGTTAYALVLSANGIGSGLYALDTTDVLVDGDGYGQGAQILLNQSGNTITGSAGGLDYFTIAINPANGDVTFTQLRNVWHASAGSTGAAYDDAALLATSAASNVQVRQTVTDSDGDSTSANVDIGQNVFSIQDDGPDAVNDTDTTGAPLSVATGNVITDLAPGDTGDSDTGADKTGTDGATIAALVSVNVPGNPDTDPGSGFSVAGAYGTLTMQANGDYSYTRNAGTPGGAKDTFTYTLKDGDGDTDTATLEITLGDAAPVAGTVNATLDDEALTNGIAGDNGDGTDANPDTSLVAGTLPDPLAGDAPLTYALSAGVTAAGGAANLTYVLTGDVLEIKQGGVTAITVTLTDHIAGTYTIVQNKPLVHANAGSENNQTFAIPYSVTDQDGQVANGTINIDVDDDTPTVTVSLATGGIAGLDETAITSVDATFGVANIGNDPNVALAGSIATGNSGTAVVTVGGGYGADGAGSLSYALSVTVAASGLQVTDGSAINLVLEGGVVVGRVQAGSFVNQAAFAIRVTSGGVVEVEQYLSLKHPANPNPDETVQLGNGSLGIQVTRTDADSDSAVSSVIDISSKVRFDDDGPSATNDTVNAVAVTQPINAAFVMDFSGSVDNDELHIQLNSVKDAAYELFASTTGGVTIRTVVFASTSISYAPVTTFTAFVTLIDSLDPAQPGGVRPISSSTDFTDAIQTLMGVYSAVPGSSNQVFFLSDGNPNEQTGSGGNSLTDARAALWNTFVDTNNVNVTAIGIGDSINAARLADVDLNDPPNNVPILVENFADLVDALNVVTLPPVAGNVMTNDAPGTDGARVTLVDNTLNGTAAQAVPNGGFVDVAGQFGTLRINSDGSYTYTYSGGAGAGQDEIFSYVLTDGDGDVATAATLTIDIDAVTGGSNFARNDMIVTNQTSPSTIPVAVLLANDGPATTVTSIASQTDATVSLLAGTVTFTDTGAAGGAFEYNATQGALTDKANVSVNRAQSGEGTLDGTAAGETLLGRDVSADTINGNGGNDYLFGLGGADSLVGGAGADTMTGGAGADTFVINTGQSTVTIGGVGNTGTIAGYDIITDFTTGVGGDILDLPVVEAAATAGNVNGAGDPALTIGGDNVESHNVTSGIASFFGTDAFTAPLVVTSAGSLAAVVQYLLGSDIGNAGSTIAFTTSGAFGNHSFVYQQTASTNGTTGGYTLVQLANVTLTNIAQANVAPIVLDLNGDGARFQSLAAGIVFDYLGTGHPTKTAWADSNDGILAIDLNGDGKVDSAREFVFGGNGLTDLQGLAANYDSNHDGLLDGRDADFARFGVWQDANSNGVSDAGEFRSLSDMGIASIGLTSDGKSYSAAGGDVTVHGESTFTWADGSTGAVADASFAIAADDSATAAAMDALLANSGVSANSGGTVSAVITTADLPAVQVALAEIEGTEFIDNLVNSLGPSGGSGTGGAQGAASDGALLGMLENEVGPDHGYGGMPLDLGQMMDEANAMAAA